MNFPYFVIFDVDSTLCTIEGIDELARMKRVEDRIQPLTEKAMNGELTLDEVFAKRLEIIQPQREDLIQLGELYRTNLSPFVQHVVHGLQKKHYELAIMSGGYKEAILPLGQLLSIPSENIYANSLQFDEAGNYQDFDHSCPLWKEKGKKEIITHLKLSSPKILVGDGMSDALAKDVVDLFIGYGGVKNRNTVREIADEYIEDMRELLPLLDRFSQTN